MSDPTDPTDPSGEPHDVGSVGEEAAKLLGALSGWARDQGGDVGAGLGGLAGQAAAAVREVDAHLATDDPECRYCPLCRTVHAVRATSPEVKAHLVTAASSLLQALSGMLATIPPAGGASGGSDLERIDLDDDTDDDTDDTGPEDEERS